MLKAKFLFTFFILPLVSPVFMSGVDLTGSLESDSEITASGSWDGNFVLSWTITNLGIVDVADFDTDTYRYEYSWTRSDGDTLSGPGVSHFILGVSDSFTIDENFEGDDLSGGVIGEEGVISWNQGGNIELPSPLFGFKLDKLPNGNSGFSFYSDRSPMLGSFFFKGGQHSAYNNGLDGGDDFAYVPDTVTTRTNPVPEPATIGLFSFAGIASILMRLRRRSRA